MLEWLSPTLRRPDVQETNSQRGCCKESSESNQEKIRNLEVAHPDWQQQAERVEATNIYLLICKWCEREIEARDSTCGRPLGNYLEQLLGKSKPSTSARCRCEIRLVTRKKS